MPAIFKKNINTQSNYGEIAAEQSEAEFKIASGTPTIPFAMVLFIARGIVSFSRVR